MSEAPILSPDAESLRQHLIETYRTIIFERYEVIIADIESAPVAITAEVARGIKDFFLSNIYPDPVARRKLDGAFEELDRFVKNPAMVWGLIGSLPKAIFKFGRQLPAALKAGLAALDAHASARKFEWALLEAAQRQGYGVPLTREQFYDCIRRIPHEELSDFIDKVSQLFAVISDSTLLAKTILIMEDVIQRMQRKPELYGPKEIGAIELGLRIIRGGYELLSPHDAPTKKAIVQFIAENERKFVRELYE